MAASMAFMPPGFLMGSVEKLVWAPAPFQSPYVYVFLLQTECRADIEFTCMGLGSKLTTTPNSSATLVRRYLANKRLITNHHQPIRGWYCLALTNRSSPGQPEVVTHVNSHGGADLDSGILTQLNFDK